MKNKGFALVELIIAMLIISLVALGATKLGSRQNKQYSNPSIAKAYVKDLQQALSGYTATHLQECTDFSGVTVQQLQDSGLLLTQSIPFPTDLFFNTDTDGNGILYAKSVDIELLVDDRELALSIGKKLSGHYQVSNNVDGLYVVAVKHQLTPFANGGSGSDLARANFALNMTEQYCFDRAALKIN